MHIILYMLTTKAYCTKGLCLSAFILLVLDAVTIVTHVIGSEKRDHFVGGRIFVHNFKAVNTTGLKTGMATVEPLNKDTPQ